MEIEIYNKHGVCVCVCVCGGGWMGVNDIFNEIGDFLTLCAFLDPFRVEK